MVYKSQMIKKEKLKYTLQIIEVNGKKVGVNTHLTNKIFYEALLNGKIINIKKSDILFKEKNLIKIQDLIFLLKKMKKVFSLKLKM